MDIELIRKYNIPGPRYTSYPTVPFWKNEPLTETDWIGSLQKNYDVFKSPDISLYIHLPFCESLCTFCGCHKRITKNHSVEEPYIETLIKEWKFLTFWTKCFSNACIWSWNITSNDCSRIRCQQN